MTKLKTMSRFTLCGVLIWALIWFPKQSRSPAGDSIAPRILPHTRPD